MVSQQHHASKARAHQKAETPFVTMKLTPYKKLLTMAKEAVDSVLAAFRANSAKKKAELEQARIDERIATLECEINEKCAQKDINFDDIIDRLDELDLAERRKRQFDKIITELFP